MDAHEPHQALDHEPGRDQDDQRERDLDRDERRAHVRKASGRAAIAGRLQVRPAEAGDRREAEEEAGRHGDEPCEPEDPRIELDTGARVAERREHDASRQHARHGAGAGPGDAKPRGAADDGDDEALAQHLSGETEA